MHFSPVIASRLEKAAVDNGFDDVKPQRIHGTDREWLGYSSMQCPMHIWLGANEDSGFLVAWAGEGVAVQRAQRHGENGDSMVYGSVISVPLCYLYGHAYPVWPAASSWRLHLSAADGRRSGQGTCRGLGTNGWA